MKYYWVIGEHNRRDLQVLSSVIKDEPESTEIRLIFLESYPNKVINKLGLGFKIYNKKLKFTDIIKNDTGLPIFSNRLKEKCEREGIEGYQTYKIEILNIKDLKELKIEANMLPYWYIHLPMIKGVLDIKKSKEGEVSKFHGKKVYNFTIPAFKEKKLDKIGIDLFRMAEENGVGIYASEKFVKMFKKNKFDGASFSEIILV